MKALIVPKLSVIKYCRTNCIKYILHVQLHKHVKKDQYTHSDGQNCLAVISLSNISWPNSAHGYIQTKQDLTYSLSSYTVLNYHKREFNSISRLSNNQQSSISFLILEPGVTFVQCLSSILDLMPHPSISYFLSLRAYKRYIAVSLCQTNPRLQFP